LPLQPHIFPEVSLKSGRKKSVELNPGQVALAQKLKIPLEKYAAEVAKLENRRD
jgi:hypothetical protein